MSEHTNKDILFLSDSRAVQIISSILGEIDRAVSTSAYRATVYLCVSAIEGIFGDLLRLLRAVDPIVRANWPRTDHNTEKRVDKLTLEEREAVLTKARALPEEFEWLYKPLREFRNYIHPDQELAEMKPIELSTAQAALCALNALIEKYRNVRFVEGAKWEAVHGAVHVSSSTHVRLMPYRGDDASVVVSEQRAQKSCGIRFDVVIPPGSVFEFVYNFGSRDSFCALRLDKRTGSDGRRGWDSGRLVCTKWREWTMSGRYANEPEVQKEHHKIEALWPSSGQFEFKVDGALLEPSELKDWGFRHEGRIGFMSECGVVRVFNVSVVKK